MFPKNWTKRKRIQTNLNHHYNANLLFKSFLQFIIIQNTCRLIPLAHGKPLINHFPQSSFYSVSNSALFYKFCCYTSSILFLWSVTINYYYIIFWYFSYTYIFRKIESFPINSATNMIFFIRTI